MQYEELRAHDHKIWYRGADDNGPVTTPVSEDYSAGGVNPSVITLATEDNIDALKAKDPTIEVGDYLVDNDGTYTVKKCEASFDLLVINKEDL